MHINSTQYTNQVQSAYKSTATNSIKGIGNEQGNNKGVGADTVTISEVGRNAKSAWEDISNKYDLTNISGKEVRKMARELYDNGLITSTEMFNMWLPPGVNFGGTGGTSLAETDHIKRNHIEEMEKDFNMMKQHGANSHEAIRGMQNVLDILKRIG